MSSVETYYQYGFYFETCAAIFSLIYFCILDKTGFGIETLICSAITGLGFFLELITSLKALRIAPLPLCTLCAFGGGIILPAICGIFFFNEPLSTYQWLGVVLFFISVYFLMEETKSQDKMTIRDLLILLLNFVINGILGVVTKHFAVNVPNGNAALYSFLSYTCASVIFLILVIVTSKNIKKTIEKKEKTACGFNLFNTFEKPLYICGIILGGVCATIVCLNTFFSNIIPIIILNIVPTAISIIGSLFIGFWFFKEKITIKKVIGIILSIISTAVIILL